MEGREKYKKDNYIAVQTTYEDIKRYLLLSFSTIDGFLSVSCPSTEIENVFMITF